MLGQATSRGQVADGIRQHGVAPGGRKMIDMEAEAAQTAIDSGLYVTWRSRKGMDCTRVGPGAKCFCGHSYQDHTFTSSKAVYPRCTTCPCQQFAFIPQRPEEVGDWWLPRRKGFNVHTWRAKCRCGHGHDEHNPRTRSCMCGCSMFQSNFACVVCDLKWEDHETVFENTTERLAQGKPVGDAFRPLADDAEIRQMVFPDGVHGGRASSSSRVRPAQVEQRFAEKSVQIMHGSSGGVIRDQGVANRWGKVERPPEEWLYKPPGYQAVGGGGGSAGGGGRELGGSSHMGAAQQGGRVVSRGGGDAGARPASRGGDAGARPASRGGDAGTRPASRGGDAGTRPASRGGDAGARPNRSGDVMSMSIVGNSFRPASASGRPAPTNQHGPPAGAAATAAAVSASSPRGTYGAPPPKLSSGFRPVYD